MKIIIAKNKISKSLKSNLKIVSGFFGDVIKCEFVEEKISKDIIYSKYDFTHIDNTKKYFNSVDETWYDENISKPYQKQGYDVAILLLREIDWQYEVYNADGSIYKVITVAGFGNMDNDWGIEEISMPYETSGTYNFNGVKLKGDKLAWTIIHELLHRFYEMKGLTDNTHKYFLEGKPEKCLEDFKIKTWKYFKLKEKTGSLGHTVADLDTRLVDILDKMREECGFPFTITSGYRTVEENKLVGGVAGSAHIKRLAVDIKLTNPSRRLPIVESALKNGIIGIGIHKDFTHLDIDDTKDKRIWIY